MIGFLDIVGAFVRDQYVLIAVLLVLLYIFALPRSYHTAIGADMALLAIFVAAQNVGALAIVVALCYVRHTRGIATELARTFRLDEQTGWTSRTIDYLIPAIREDVLSSPADPAEADRSTPAVHEPVRQYDTDAAGTGEQTASIPDTDADYATADATRHNTHYRRVVWIAMQRNADGSYWKSSANAVYDAVGGTRAEVLAWVKEIRDKPVQRPLTDEQKQLRNDLQLTPESRTK